jgi:hypothetical protein
MSAGLEVADVFRHHGEAYRLAHAGHLGRVERRVMSAIELCRTAALGGHTEQCEDCGIVRIAYNSCRNRHCPKFRGAARDDWLAARAAELCRCPTSMSCPPCRRRRSRSEQGGNLHHPVQGGGQALRKSLPTRSTRAEIGVLAVLHTWGQTLHHHPHIHCVVPGGGPSPDGARWIDCRPGFFIGPALSGCFAGCSWRTGKPPLKPPLSFGTRPSSRRSSRLLIACKLRRLD